MFYRVVPLGYLILILSVHLEPKPIYTGISSMFLDSEGGLEPPTYELWARQATNCSTPKRIFSKPHKVLNEKQKR